jgi:hypothetical protein
MDQQVFVRQAGEHLSTNPRIRRPVSTSANRPAIRSSSLSVSTS